MDNATPEEVGFSTKRLERLNNLMQSYIDSNKLAGIVTLLAREGRVFHFEKFGHADIESQRPIELDSIFRIYSMTKPITSTAVMMLYEEGHFHLDDPVSKFIPQLDNLKVYAGMGQTGLKYVPQERPISIRHLLTHTSGLSYGFHQDTPVDEMYRQSNILNPNGTLEDSLAEIAELPLAYQPGTSWRYSVATDVLGYLVQVISGQGFDQFLKERILDPLGMNDTAFYVPEEKLDRFTTVYGPGSNGSIVPLTDDRVSARYQAPVTKFSGGGGLVSTASDYATFCQAVLNGGELNDVRLLSPKTVELMMLNHLPDELMPYSVSQAGAESTRGCGFGLGYRVILDIAEHGILGSEGSCSWGGAASTQFWIDPQEDMLAVFMTQFMPSGHYPIAREFRIATYQALVE